MRALLWTGSAVVLALVAVTGCGDDQSPGGDTTPQMADPDYPPMAFTVDREQLQAPVPIPSYGLEIAPPRGWERIADAQLDAMTTELAARGRSRPLLLFLSVATGELLLVTTPEPPGGGIQNLLAATGAPADRQARFSSHGLCIGQAVLDAPDGSERTYRLFVAAPGDAGVVQVDIVIPVAPTAGNTPRRLDPTVAHRIESIIGSIRPSGSPIPPAD